MTITPTSVRASLWKKLQKLLNASPHDKKSFLSVLGRLKSTLSIRRSNIKVQWERYSENPTEKNKLKYIEHQYLQIINMTIDFLQQKSRQSIESFIRQNIESSRFSEPVPKKRKIQTEDDDHDNDDDDLDSNYSPDNEPIPVTCKPTPTPARNPVKRQKVSKDNGEQSSLLASRKTNIDKFIETHMQDDRYGDMSDELRMGMNNLDEENKKKIINELNSILHYDSAQERIVNTNWSIRFLLMKLPPRIKRMLLEKKLTTDGAKYDDWFNTVCKIPFDIYRTPQSIQPDSDWYQSCMIQLNKKIYGHDQTKHKLMQYICKKLTGSTTQLAGATTIGLQGPPGIGKTTFAKHCVADLLGQDLIQISLSGVTDPHYLIGHGFTYEGAEPGQITKELIRVGNLSPVILLDEVCKCAPIVQQQIMSLIDPVQNSSFQDAFVGNIEIPLNRCTFILSYNDSEKIDPVLLNRINEIRLPGYTVFEKIQICQEHLVPGILREYTTTLNVSFTNDVLEFLITHMATDYGMRKIKELLQEIISEINLQKNLHSDRQDSVTITRRNVEKYLHPDHFAKPDLVLTIHEKVSLMQTKIIPYLQKNVNTPVSFTKDALVRIIEEFTVADEPVTILIEIVKEILSKIMLGNRNLYLITEENYLEFMPVSTLVNINKTGITSLKKVKIMQNYIIPQLRLQYNALNFKITDDCLEYLIHAFTFENALKDITSIVVSIMSEYLLDYSTSVVTTTNVHRFFKNYTQVKLDTIPNRSEVGSISGMFATGQGGGIMPIMGSFVSSLGKFEVNITGNIGKIMTESAQVARTLAWNLLTLEKQLELHNRWKENPVSLHIHCCEGSISKEGPSAGTALTVAMYSILTNIPIHRDIAITGEINLRGEVMKIGGLHEKLHGAKLAGVRLAIIPTDNIPDLNEIKEKCPELVNEHFQVQPISSIHEALHLSLAFATNTPALA